MSDCLQQTLIGVISGISIYLLAGVKYRKLGFLVGLLGQPLWIYATFKTGQWGMFFVALWVTGNHIRGFLNNNQDKTGDKK